MKTKEAKEVFYLLSLMHEGAQCELNHHTPYELLVAVILSAQCTDKRVNLITDKLFKVYNTPEVISKLRLEELKPYIFSCGFYNNKGKNIIEMSKKLMDKHNGKVPSTMEELVALDGVGRKTASVVLAVAFGIPAMPVDTHVFRVSRRLGLASGKNPEIVEKELTDIMEKEKWHDFHHYMIFHGRYICHSRKPDCGNCNLTKICKYYEENEKVKEE